MSGKLDRRVRRTRRLLRGALIDLLGMRDFSTITIREITARADIAYSTFFLHYTGKDDLLSNTLQTFVDELLTAIPVNSSGDFEAMFQHVHDHAAMHRILHTTPAAEPMRAVLKQQLAAQLMEKAQACVDSPPLDLVAHQLISGLMGLVEWWLANDLDASVATMTAYYDQLVAKPMQLFLIE